MQAASHPSGLYQSDVSSRTPFVVLLVASLLEALVMVHHPSVDATDPLRAVTQIAALARRSGIVHGILIGLMLLIGYGFIEFIRRRGSSRAWIRLGALAYGCGVALMLGAAMASGFVITGAATLLPHGTPDELRIALQFLLFCRVLNQSCANAAVVAMSAGIAFWSLDLWRSGAAARGVALGGGVIAAVSAFALLGGVLRLDVHGMLAIVLAQGAWNVAVALLMSRSSGAVARV
jgi:hypothetical protein